jgi:hypothetical protein
VQVTITLSEIDLEKMALESFYQSEKRVKQIVNNIGKVLTREILQFHDIDNKTIERDGQTWSLKEASTGHYQTLYGAGAVSRHLYQTGAGKATRCPVEEACALSRSGMRWDRDSGAKALQSRAIRLCDQWDSFWGKVMRYAA